MLLTYELTAPDDGSGRVSDAPGDSTYVSG